MRRKIDEALLTWKNKAARKPLLVIGARQVGKTYALVTFGQKHFANYVHIDFSRDATAKDLFATTLDPHKVIERIEAFTKSRIKPEETLLIFDEIQLCEEALTSLKYFCEDAPQYCVAAAGSLLGVKLRSHGSFPVGKVNMVAIHPMDFEEYLWSQNDDALSNIIQESLETFTACPLHEAALDRLREYLMLGGMPDVINIYTSSLKSGLNKQETFMQARDAQNAIDQAYVVDITKHAPSSEIPKILDVWKSIPSQLAKENHKFQYKTIKSGARSSAYESAVDWLLAASIISRCTRVTEPVAPLRAFEDVTSFKLYRADTGLLSASYEILPTDVLPQDNKASYFRGSVTENYVMQQFIANDVQPNYWGVPSKQEVDFVARNFAGDVIPIEVKSGIRVRSNSLEGYRKKYQPPYVVRFSAKNFGEENQIRSIPLYAATYYAQQFIPTLQVI